MVMAMRFKQVTDWQSVIEVGFTRMTVLPLPVYFQLSRIYSSAALPPVVALRIELSAIRLSDGYGLQPSTTVSSSRAPRGRTEILLLPKQACSHLHLCPINRSRK